MSSSLVISLFGYIDATGWGGKGGAHRWDQSQGQLAQALRWRMVSASAHDRFGRMDLLSKYVSVAVEMLGLPSLDKQGLRLETAIVMGTMGGCYGADLNFYRGILQGDGPSPTLFAYTLPTIALGEVAIRQRLGGASYCFMTGADSGLLALWESVKLLEAGECQKCVCIMADVLSQHAEMMVRNIDPGGKALTEYAYAFLLERHAHAQAYEHPSLARVAITSDADGADSIESWKVPDSLIGLLREGRPGRLDLTSPPASGIEEILSIIRCSPVT
ncbi:MAG: beta-ketoacyl synthase N-terminal-like domain-containing protein [Desulfobaccales bacterium]